MLSSVWLLCFFSTFYKLFPKYLETWRQRNISVTLSTFIVRFDLFWELNGAFYNISADNSSNIQIWLVLYLT